MKPDNLIDLSTEQLSQQLKKLKTNKIIDAIIVGFTIGIAVYSAVKNGFGFFTFFPLLMAYVVVRNSKNTKILENEIQRELQSRNLN